MIASTPSADRRFFINAVNGLARIGVDLPAVCARRGLANPLDEPGERIPLAQTSRIFKCIAEETGDPEYLYKLADHATVEGFGTIFQLVACCSTLLDAIRVVCRFSSIATDAVTYSFSERDKHVDLLVTANHETIVSPDQLEAALFVLVQAQRMIQAGSEPMVLEASFTHAPRFPVARYVNYFGCPVLFNQRRNGLRLPRSTLEARMPGADARLRTYYCSVAERYESDVGTGDALQMRVQRLFVQRMAFGEPDREDISRALNMSARTLHRQLRESGLSYRKLIEQARLSAAKKELLTSERPIHEIAFLVGYADVRSFRRAFQRWTGSAPAEFRCKSQNRISTGNASLSSACSDTASP